MRVAIAALTALGCVAPVCADDWNKHWSTEGKPELRVHAGDAAVIIEARDGNGIDASLTTRGWKIGHDGVQVSEHQSGNAVDIDIRVPSTFMSFGNRSIQLTLRVPREILGDIHTGDGSIKLLGVHGELRVNTGDGSVRGEDLDGLLDARSGDGSVHVAGRFDNVQLHTQDGSVELEAVRGSRLQTGWHLETGDGSMHVTVPRDLNADLELRTGDGHIAVDLPLNQQQKTEHETRGRLNAGGPPLLVKTGDGSITLNAR